MNSELVNNPDPSSLNPAASLIEQGLQQGLAFCAEKRWPEAAACFEAILQQEPTHKIAWNNLGNVRDELGDALGAYQAFEAALAIDPDYASPKKNLAIVAYKQGGILYAAGQLQEALAAFQTAATQGLAPLVLADYDHSYLQLLLETCEHQHVATHVAIMMARTRADESYLPHPYPLLAAVDQPAWHKLGAKRHVTRLCNEAGVRVTRPAGVFPSRQNQSTPRRIRIAYLSCDWHQHPVPQQLIASIEAHDRSKFEVIGIATDGDADTTPWRARIEHAFDQFFMLGALSDSQIAEQLRSMDIDIAIDLSLYMQSGRPLILASRPCRVQVAFLGYAGTSSAPWIDYLIADGVVIPPTHESLYSEKIIRLSGSFMPDNNQRRPAHQQESRSVGLIQQGLPESGFVFCAFSNPYKITPEMLACWFRLLHAVPSSVLWLQANNEVTQKHIEAAGVAAGVAPQRLVFAMRVDSFDEHLQRYQLADLFLDSFPYNAHVTAADSLWMGLPVLTLQGASFASRVASSILTALALPELITQSMASYEARAMELANDAIQLQSLRHKLERSKAAGLYFNQTQYLRALEDALTVIANPAPKKLIAFSLWGDNSTYRVGALRNAELAAKLYPDWVCRFYCADDLPQDFLNQLQEHPNVQVVLMPPKPDRGGAFWRFLAAEDAGVSHVLFRDTDSRLSLREVAAVNEWLESDKDAHLMRDHPYHWPSIMAGMWGCKGGVLLDWQARLDAYQPTTEYGADQQFLADVIYPQIKERCVIHDAFGISEAGLDVRPFPAERVGKDFVGQCFDAQEQSNGYYAEQLSQTVYEQAQSLYSQEDGLAHASELFKQASQLDPTHFEALHMQGICLARLRQPTQALKIFQSALLLNSSIASLHNNIGLVLDELTLFDEAVASFDEAIRLNPQYTQAHIHKAQTLLKTDLKEAAIRSLRLALQVDPSLDAVWHQCVALHVQMRQWPEALLANESALAIAPDHLDYRYAQAIILGQLGQADKAKAAFVAMQTLGVEGADLASYHLAQYGGYPTPDKAPAGYVKNLFDGFANHFDTDLVTHLNYQVPRLMGDIIHRALLDAAINMLDLGCGTGLVGAALHSRPRRLVGVDLSSKMLAKAKEKQLYHELQESGIDAYLKAETSNLARRYFDVITAADVFIYMGDLALVFECVAGLLRANGLFIFSTEDSASEPIFLTPSGRYAHHQTYIDQLVNRHGFEIQACDAVDLRMELLKPTRGCIFTLSLQR